MSETKHTPGPWFVTGAMTKYIEARIGCGMVQEVAAVGPTDADGGYGEQQHANASLVAAAPELLDALEDALHGVEGNHPLDADIHSWQDAARAAIAKAKGQP